MKRIIQGREVDESQVDEWVAEAEAGYEAIRAALEAWAHVA